MFRIVGCGLDWDGPPDIKRVFLSLAIKILILLKNQQLSKREHLLKHKHFLKPEQNFKVQTLFET